MKAACGFRCCPQGLREFSFVRLGFRISGFRLQGAFLCTLGGCTLGCGAPKPWKMALTNGIWDAKPRIANIKRTNLKTHLNPKP